MLVSTRTARTPSVEQLVHCWAELYTIDLSSLLAPSSSQVYGTVIDASSAQGRLLTAAKLNETLLGANCQFAVTQAQSLYEYLPTILSLEEADHLTQVAYQVYEKLLVLYQHSAAAISLSMDQLWAIASGGHTLSWGIQEVEEMADALGPVLLKHQSRYLSTRDWRALGFITTQLNFSNALLLKRLTPAERLLIQPFFKFVEEQVAIPWARVCAASAQHALHSPALGLVTQLLPASPEIAIAVHRQLIDKLPHHRSRRGSLSDAAVAHSCIRDLSMFQAYLWLCVLQESLEPIEQELVPLCLMVMDSVEVKWELIVQWNQVLTSEILSRVDGRQRSLLRPYTEGLKQAFHNGRKDFNWSLE